MWLMCFTHHCQARLSNRKLVPANLSLFINKEYVMITFTLVLIIVFALIYDLSNGWNDAAGSIATVISTRFYRR